MTLAMLNQFVHDAINSNAQITLIILSSAVLLYTIIASGLSDEWSRYGFLVFIGFALYIASSVMTDHINRDFFSSLSTELFGAAITLIVLGKWMVPSIWWLVILAPLVIGSELLIYKMPDSATQSYYLGICSNIWGAFLVAILIEELVHDRNRKGSSDLTTFRERFQARSARLDEEIAQLEKRVSEETLRRKELDKRRLELALNSTKPSDWDVEIKIYGRNPPDLQNRLQHISEIMQLVESSDVYTHPNNHCHCYVKATTKKSATRSSKEWMVISETALQQDASAGK